MGKTIDDSESIENRRSFDAPLRPEDLSDEELYEAYQHAKEVGPVLAFIENQNRRD